MTRALSIGVAIALAFVAIYAGGMGFGWAFANWVMVPFHDPHHMAHWPVVATVTALTLTVLMALTSHHRTTR